MPMARIAFSNAGSMPFSPRDSVRSLSTRWLASTVSPAYQLPTARVAAASAPSLTPAETVIDAEPTVNVPETVIRSEPLVETTVYSPSLPSALPDSRMVAPTSRLAKVSAFAAVMVSPPLTVRPPVTAGGSVAVAPTCAARVGG